MAEIVQLKNDNGASVYPVTMGEAINMAGGKTLDQAFNEAKSQILNDINAKKNELATEVENKKTEFNQLYNDKIGLLDTEFTTKTAELQTDFDGKTSALQSDFNGKKAWLEENATNFARFAKTSDSELNLPIGSMIIARWMMPTGGAPYVTAEVRVFGTLLDSTYDYECTMPGSTSGITSTGRPVSGKWITLGKFKTPDNTKWMLLCQRYE